MKKKKTLKDYIYAVECEVTCFGKESVPIAANAPKNPVFGKSYHINYALWIICLIDVNTDKNIKKILFSGSCDLEVGDKIRAYLSLARKIGWDNKERKVTYLQRHFKKREEAIMIEKLREGKVVAIYKNIELYNKNYEIRSDE
jgi:hypothetical protein